MNKRYLVISVFLLLGVFTAGNTGHPNNAGPGETGADHNIISGSDVISTQIAYSDNDSTSDEEYEEVSHEKNSYYEADDPKTDLLSKPLQNVTIKSANQNSNETKIKVSPSSTIETSSTQSESETTEFSSTVTEEQSGGTSTFTLSSSQSTLSSDATETNSSTNSETELVTLSTFQIPENSSSTISSNTTDEVSVTTSPFPITTQDLGDVSNYTTPAYRGDDGGDSVGLKPWAIVLVSVLISFALIFTILYFIRGAIIRRRKEDQRRLLRASISSEGFFHGDGDGNNGKFEL